MSFNQDITDNFGKDTVIKPELSFVVDCEGEFFDFMQTIKMSEIESKLLIETGTASGISSLLLSSFVEKIITFDVIDISVKYSIWDFYKVKNKIEFHLIKDTSEINEFVKEDFDFAFIDGDHSYEGCNKDIQILERCGKLLFHDVNYPPVGKAIQELLTKKGGDYISTGRTFGYWQKGIKDKEFQNA